VARLALLDKVLDELFTDEHVRSWRSLIIDLSYNEGGDDELGLSLAGRLTDTAYLAYTRGGAVLRHIGPAMTQLRMLRWQLCTARRHAQGGRAHSQRAVDADRPATPDDGTGAVRDIERLVKPRVADSLPSVGKSRFDRAAQRTAYLEIRRQWRAEQTFLDAHRLPGASDPLPPPFAYSRRSR
jgi:hypothetical protein